MHSKWRNYTKTARREAAQDLAESRFRQHVRQVDDKELARLLTHLTDKLAKTHARYIWVRDRLACYLGEVRAETLRRAAGRVSPQSI
jgi:hypothetical protein